jgi:Hydrolytic ATP binding site of dynein motor region
MVAAVRAAAADAITALPAAPRRPEVARALPAQAVLLAAAVHWTSFMESAVADAALPGALDAAVAHCSATLQDTANLIRDGTPGSRSADHPASVRRALAGLVAADMHARDITTAVAEMQAAGGVLTADCFTWKAQLRTYWEVGDDGCADAVMRVLSAVVCYGHEYLGSCARLAATPQTDRCHRALLVAVHAGLGGALQGPANVVRFGDAHVGNVLLWACTARHHAR